MIRIESLDGNNTSCFGCLSHCGSIGYILQWVHVQTETTNKFALYLSHAELWSINLQNVTMYSSFMCRYIPTKQIACIGGGMSYLLNHNLFVFFFFKHYFALVSKQSTLKKSRFQQNSLWSSHQSDHSPHPLIYKKKLINSFNIVASL